MYDIDSGKMEMDDDRIMMFLQQHGRAIGNDARAKNENSRNLIRTYMEFQKVKTPTNRVRLRKYIKEYCRQTGTKSPID